MIAETWTMSAMLKDLSKKALYASGLLGLYHRIRNADTLTVVMFHRILPPDDPRFASCDPDYTLTTEVFGQCLAFFGRHYSVVSEAEVLASRAEGRALPRNALLVTFDDGWSDNADHALPVMRKFGFPGLLFVVSDVIGRRQPFVQEAIVAAWRRGALTVAGLSAAIDAIAGSPAPRAAAGEESIDALRVEIARLEALDAAGFAAVASLLGDVLDDGLRHMVDVDDLRRLQSGNIALGLHGKTHARMTRVDDLEAELGGARQALEARLGSDLPAARSMSFPHGAHDAAIARRARDAGYELVFTSRRLLNPVGDRLGWLLGRTGFETDTVVDATGRFRPDLLALELFRCARGRLGD
jgi:peptidoglycan/xylan/chitin deacetylase (PgdA/CDA1 family)